MSMAIGSESIRINSLRLSVRKNERIICTHLIRALFKQVWTIYKFIPTLTIANMAFYSYNCSFQGVIYLTYLILLLLQ